MASSSNSSLMAYNPAASLGGMLPSGTRHFADSNSGVVLRNVDACLQLSRMIRTSLGPQGRCKLVVNHLGKLIVTSDCASILEQVRIEHPAAQLLAAACTKQQEEYGDNTNWVLAVGGELLMETAKLISKMGTWKHASEILQGYQTALKVCRDELLPGLQAKRLDMNSGGDSDDGEDAADATTSDEDTMLQVLRPVLASKQYGSETILAPLVAQACRSVAQRSETTQKITKIPVSHVRTVKILGSTVAHSQLIPGFCTPHALSSVTTRATNCKIVVFACGVEASTTEAKGTVLMHTADDLLSYNATEERKMQDIIQSLVDAGVQVIIAGGNVSDMALHCIDTAGLVLLRIGSKWELRRLCQAVQATALVRLGAPTPDEMGWADCVEQREIGGHQTLTVLENNRSSSIATIVLRASTHTLLADLERAVDDGVHAVANAVRDGGRVVYGGGAVEMALSRKLTQRALQTPGLEQYAWQALAEALKVVPRTLAENAGRDAVTALADLQAAHSSHAAAATGPCDVGINIDSESTETTASMSNVVDLMSTKLSALQLAVDAVVTILKIDQIIMSKPAGAGPTAS